MKRTLAENQLAAILAAILLATHPGGSIATAVSRAEKILQEIEARKTQRRKKE